MKLIASNAEETYAIASRAYEEKGGLYTLRNLTSDIRALSKEEIEDEGSSNKRKGDLFEIFAYFFFAANKYDPRIGLNNYEPISIEDDYGVDGVGVNAAGNRVAVQVKFRSNPTDLITYEDVAKTFCAGKKMLRLNLEEANTVYVFTNSNGVNHYCEKVLGNSLKVINKDILKPYVDNNVEFWGFFFDSIYSYLDQEGGQASG